MYKNLDFPIYTPGANAICYFPFFADTNDFLGNKTLTNDGLKILDVDGIRAIYNDGTGGAKINTGFKYTDVKAFLMRVKPIANGNLIGARNINNTNQERNFGVSGSNYYCQVYKSPDGGWTYSNMPKPTGWACIGASNDSSNQNTFYINGTKYTGGRTYPTFDQLNDYTGILCKYDTGNYTNKIRGYMSNLILYSAEITESKYTDFYNSTKSVYGL